MKGSGVRVPASAWHELYRERNRSGLETLRHVALIQGTEASNAIENIHAPLARTATAGSL
jgi:hypothetical protein